MKAIDALPAFPLERRGNSTTFRSSLMTIARIFVIDEALGRSRGGYSTKIHLRCERGKPMEMELALSQRR
jgi:hypothetical protein